MRKIFSILVVLGLVLSMSVVTAPVAADAHDCDGEIVSPPAASICAGERIDICFNFTSPRTMLAGNDYLELVFAPGTTFAAGATITIEANGSGPETIAAGKRVFSANSVKFELPFQINLGDSVDICVTRVNQPAAHGDYELEIWFDALCCPPELICVIEYEVVRAIATYKFDVNFGPTYPGIAWDFIPPFKACGQNSTGEPFNTYEFAAGKWASNFTLGLRASVAGCFAPCVNATMWFTVPKIVDDATISFWIDDVLYELTEDDVFDDDGEVIEFPLDDIPLASSGISYTYQLALHFDTIGDYQINFYAECPEVVCEDDASIFAQISMPFEVHQWKDANYFDVGPKWSLISLPIVPFDTSVQTILAPISVGAYGRFGGLIANLAFRSIWHYDRCADSWAVYGNGQTSLTDIEDGKAYWVRMMTPGEWNDAYGALGLGGLWNYPLTARVWVFGLKAPKAPSSPSAYPVCPGWNMVGFRSTADMAESLYLWSVAGLYQAPAIYGWTGGATQDWFTVAPGGDLFVGHGYWIPFLAAGEIYPPLP